MIHYPPEKPALQLRYRATKYRRREDCGRCGSREFIQPELGIDSGMRARARCMDVMHSNTFLAYSICLEHPNNEEIMEHMILTEMYME